MLMCHMSCVLGSTSLSSIRYHWFTRARAIDTYRNADTQPLQF